MPQIAMAVFDLIGRISAEATVSGVWNAYLGAAQDCGLSFGIASFLPGDRSLDRTVFADDMPKGWLAHYVEQDYQDQDPLMQRNLERFTPFEWDIREWSQTPIPKQRSWYLHNMSSGVVSGLTIPDRSDGNLKIITLCGDPGPLDMKDRVVLHFAGLEALLRMRELGLHPDTPMPREPLSERERECLYWVAAGKSDWEIGQILSLSEKTVNIYVERAKHKMRAHTRAQAVVIAARNGLIRP
jgi:DNA-binding CsgD family transcriptional regulator